MDIGAPKYSGGSWNLWFNETLVVPADKSVPPLGTRASSPIDPRVVGMGRIKSPSGLLGVTISGPLSLTYTSWVPGPMLLPVRVTASY